MTNVKNKPNLFYWATSELSQDAFICWLLEWANFPEDEALYKTAKFFVSKLTKGRVTDFKKIEIKRQPNKMDIVCIIDTELAILIEDKTNTSDYAGQLEKYLSILCKSYKRENVFPVYLKTGDQSDFSSPKKAGYSLFLRKDFLEILEFGKNQQVENEIFYDFFDHLKRIEISVKSYKTLPLAEWHWGSWKGFYTELQTKIGTGNWKYVPQKNGGFLGFWWSWYDGYVDDIKYRYYLQLEHRKFCFKIIVSDKNVAIKVREHFRIRLFDEAKKMGIDIHRNGRIGKSMTVAVLTNPYRSEFENKLLNFEGTISNLKKAELLLKSVSIIE